MDCLLEFQDDIMPAHVERPLPSPSSASSSKGYKFVPWLNWTEWESVRDSLFSGSPDKVSFAIKRIATWRSRGSLPVVVDVTASIIEIQQKDPMLRKDLADNAIHSEQMLAMLYCMAILRLVNCVVEKTRKKTEISIADAAGAIGIPRTLIDIRHEGSHRDLPALPLVRDSAAKAIEWLRAYYWDPQTKQIPFQGDGSASVRKEIKSHLRELASCLKDKQHGSLLKHGKCGKHHEQLFGRGKFVSLMANKLHSSKSRGTKKQTTKILKILCHLYSSFSSEVLSVLLEFLLKALDSSNLMEHEDGQEINTLLNDWKAVIMKFANKEPELLLMLLKAVLNMIETQTTMEFDMAMPFTKLEHMTGTSHVEQLSSLFAWFVGQLEGLKPPHSIDVPAETKPIAYHATLMNLLRKCLLVSSRGNKQLLDSALHLAQLMGGNSSLLEKLNKLCLLGMIDTDATGDASSLASSNKLLALEDELIHQAAKKLESLKLRRFKSKAMKASDCGVSSSGRWVVAKSWNPCPIGMLPRELGSSGCLPDLDAVNDNEHSVDPSVRTQAWELNSCSNVRESNHSILSLDNPNAAGSNKKSEASWDIPVLDESTPKRIRESVESHGSDSTEDVHEPKGVQGCLVRNGVWKKVGEEELAAIVSGLRILV